MSLICDLYYKTSTTVLTGIVFSVDTTVSVQYYHIIFFNPIKPYPLIRYTGKINQNMITPQWSKIPTFGPWYLHLRLNMKFLATVFRFISCSLLLSLLKITQSYSFRNMISTWHNIPNHPKRGMHPTTSKNNFMFFTRKYPILLHYAIISPGLLAANIWENFQNQFSTCSEQPGQKCELGLLFNNRMPAPLQIGDCVILRVTDNGYI